MLPEEIPHGALLCTTGQSRATSTMLRSRAGGIGTLCTDVISVDVSHEPPSRDSASPCRNTHDNDTDERAGDSGRGGRFTDEIELVAATREESTMPLFAMASFIASSIGMSTTWAAAWEVMARV